MIKKVTLFAIYCFVIAFVSSCTKEVGSTEAGPVASFKFDGSVSPVVAGIYVAGQALNSSNTVKLTINVTARGKYTITTNSANGVRFYADGTFTATGLQTIILTGLGTPQRDGNFTFSTTTGSSPSFGITFLPTAPAAVFTYAGAPSACTTPVVNGSYGTGVAMTSANYLDVAVNVSSIGSYAVTTNATNGMVFTGSGNFSETGAKIIRLTGNGTPVSSGSYTFSAPGGCPFTVTVTNGGGTSVYTLDCATPVIAGSYITGLPLGSGNTVTIKANVTVAGTYTISTGPAVNGMTFLATGTFAVGNGQTVVLTGSGSPASAANNSFTIAGGCPFSITSVDPPPASYTLTCNGTSVAGTYVVGTALTSSNRVDVEVNVTIAGGYTITSSTANGITFSKTGVFTGTGIQTVTLQGAGTPTGSAGPVNFTVGTAACPFTVNLTAPTSPCTGLTTNKFTIAGAYSISGTPLGFDIGTGFQYIMQEGLVKMEITFPGNTPPAPGTYSIGAVTIHSLAADFRDWNATSGTVYVGATSIEFCNVSIRGTTVVPGGGGPITSTCEARMQ